MPSSHLPSAKAGLQVFCAWCGSCYAPRTDAAVLTVNRPFEAADPAA